MKQTIERIKLVKNEMRNCFQLWDLAIENKQQPVTIQDLDFWAKELEAVIMFLNKKKVV